MLERVRSGRRAATETVDVDADDTGILDQHFVDAFGVTARAPQALFLTCQNSGPALSSL
jgi:hypothetical protein